MSTGFSIEDERDGRSRAGSVRTAADDVAEALAAIEEAESSVEISLALRRVVAKRVLLLIDEGRMGGGDLVKLMGMIADRVDGKVADRVEVNMTSGDEAILAVRELVSGGVLSIEAGKRQLIELGVRDVEVLDE